MKRKKSSKSVDVDGRCATDEMRWARKDKWEKQIFVEREMLKIINKREAHKNTDDGQW